MGSLRVEMQVQGHALGSSIRQWVMGSWGFLWLVQGHTIGSSSSSRQGVMRTGSWRVAWHV